METIRSFIAVEFDPEIKEALKRIQTGLKKSNAQVSWVKPDNIHLTLKFLGEIPPNQLTAAQELLPVLVKTFPAFTVSITGLGGFPRAERPRIIWVGIEDGKETLSQLAAAIEEGMEKIGFKKGREKFSAHITLGRVRSVQNLQALASILPCTTVLPVPVQTVRNVILFKSTLTPRGPIYEPLMKIPLAATP